MSTDPKAKGGARPPPAQRPGPSGGKRQQNRERRIRDLQNAGRDLFLERGVAAVTIDEIVDRTGVAKGSFYRYFEDKEALVQSLIKPLGEALVEGFRACDAALRASGNTQESFDAYRLLAEHLAAAILVQPETALLYLQESRAPAVGARQPIAEFAQDVLERAIALTRVAREHGILRPINPVISASAVVGMVERILYEVLRGRDMGDPIELSESLVELVLNGVRSTAD